MPNRHERAEHQPDADRATARPADFEDSEGLRALLQRLHTAGAGAWRHDPEAAALMRFTTRRYARLAVKYEQTPEDAAVAAFEAMLNESTRTAADPWAVVTWAVRITLIAEHRANGLLTSSARARRPEYSVFHDAERFSDRDIELTDFHPAFHVPAPDHHSATPTRTGQATGEAAELLRLLGWDATTVTTALDYICKRLPSFGDRASAYDSLRRDKTARVLLDLPHDAWIGLLRVVLGHPTATSAPARRGVLARLLIGETLTDLLTDRRLVHLAVISRPRSAKETSR